MAQKLGGLSDLPKSGSKFWKHSDKQQVELRFKPKCNHYFIRKSGREVECRKCGAGLFLSPPWHIEKGRLYKGLEKVL